MTIAEMIEICLCCIAYAHEQVKTSHINVLGYNQNGDDEDSTKTIDALCRVYMELDALIPDAPYWRLTRKEVLEGLRLDLD